MQAIPEERGVQPSLRIQEARADVMKEDVLPVRQALEQAVVRGDALWPETRRLLSADVARQDGQQVKPRVRLLDPNQRDELPDGGKHVLRRGVIAAEVVRADQHEDVTRTIAV